MSELEFLNTAAIIICLIVLYMTVHMILSTPYASYNFKSTVRLFALVICAGIFFYGTVVFVEELKYSKAGIITNAVVDQLIEKQAKAGVGDSKYLVKYSFADQYNLTHQGLAEVEEYDWQMSKLDPERKMKIVYLNDDPSQNKIYNSPSYFKSVLFVFLGFSGLLFSLIKRSKMVYSTGVKRKSHSPADLLSPFKRLKM